MGVPDEEKSAGRLTRPKRWPFLHSPNIRGRQSAAIQSLELNGTSRAAAILIEAGPPHRRRRPPAGGAVPLADRDLNRLVAVGQRIAIGSGPHLGMPTI